MVQESFVSVGNDKMYMNDADMGYVEESFSSTEQVARVDGLLGSWIFVGGVGFAALVLGVLVGFLAAKRKIKKGMDLYED